MKVQVLPAEGQAGPREDSPCHKMWNKQEKIQLQKLVCSISCLSKSNCWYSQRLPQELVFTATSLTASWDICLATKVRPCITLSNFWFSIPKLSGSQSLDLLLPIKHCLLWEAACLPFVPAALLLLLELPGSCQPSDCTSCLFSLLNSCKEAHVKSVTF